MCVLAEADDVTRQTTNCGLILQRCLHCWRTRDAVHVFGWHPARRHKLRGAVKALAGSITLGPLIAKEQVHASEVDGTRKVYKWSDRGA